MNASDTLKSPTRKRANSRERIIDAAIELVCAESVGKLSLEAVAERAGLSKGGLLYNFPNKTALLQAMVARHIDALSAAVETAAQVTAADGRPNAVIRAYLMAVRDLISENNKPAAGFLAAISEEPALLDPVRRHHARLVAELERTSDTPELAQIAFLAVEGIRCLRLFDTSPFGDDELMARFDTMIALMADPPQR